MVSEIKQKYKFPFLLKQRLVEEWYIVKNRKLFIPLPRSPNIKQILQLVYIVFVHCNRLVGIRM